MKTLFVGGPLDHKVIDLERPLPDTYRHIPDDSTVDGKDVVVYKINRLGSRREVYYVYSVDGMTQEKMIKALMDHYAEPWED